MPVFTVIVEETLHLSYQIEAETAEEAEAIWEAHTSDELPEPDEECIGCGVRMVIDETGNVLVDNLL